MAGKGEAMSNVTKVEQEEAVTRLKDWLKPGDTVHCILRHVSRSGMFRVIDLQKINTSDEILGIGWYVAKALDLKFDRDRHGIRVSGCGMDMGLHLVYNLSRILFHGTFTCIGRQCPSNDHCNGDRNYRRHKHSDGGYALTHRWL